MPAWHHIVRKRVAVRDAQKRAKIVRHSATPSWGTGTEKPRATALFHKLTKAIPSTKRPLTSSRYFNRMLSKI